MGHNVMFPHLNGQIQLIGVSDISNISHFCMGHIFIDTHLIPEIVFGAGGTKRPDVKQW